jgi:hypothetical protein
MIEDDLEKMHLVPGEYVFMSGFQPWYRRWSRTSSSELVSKCLNCVSSLRPGGPFFFSSDSAYAKEVAIEYGERNTVVVARTDTHRSAPWIRFEDRKARDPAEFYDILSICTYEYGTLYESYNMGGYGKWGVLCPVVILHAIYGTDDGVGKGTAM